MNCVNHIGVNSTAYCQNCGKALCAACVRTASGGQILCESCWMEWQRYQQPFIAPAPSGPNPVTAAVLGIIPGVGAMYNGQFLKGFIHVAVFAVLVTGASEFHGPYDILFGLFIPAWILYQSFEAYHTAKALRDGLPLPDPFGLNEAGNWLNMGARPRNPSQNGASEEPVNPDPGAAGQVAESQQPLYAGYRTYPTPAPPPANGFPDPGAPPPAPIHWRRQEPVGAIVLIALGTLFLLAQLDIFHGRLLEFAWPILLIALGIWLIVRRLEDSQGDRK
jgi:TM2 domain-containing membrane protein YozV